MTDLSVGAEKFFTESFDGVIRIEAGDKTALWVDGRKTPPVLSDKAPENVTGAFCLWQASPETIGRIFSDGARQLEAAYIAGRLTISGDMAVMARLEPGRE